MLCVPVGREPRKDSASTKLSIERVATVALAPGPTRTEPRYG